MPLRKLGSLAQAAAPVSEKWKGGSIAKATPQTRDRSPAGEVQTARKWERVLRDVALKIAPSTAWPLNAISCWCADGHRLSALAQVRRNLPGRECFQKSVYSERPRRYVQQP